MPASRPRSSSDFRHRKKERHHNCPIFPENLRQYTDQLEYVHVCDKTTRSRRLFARDAGGALQHTRLKLLLLYCVESSVLVNSQLTPALSMHMTYSNRLVWPRQWHTQTRCADGLLLHIYSVDYLYAPVVVNCKVGSRAETPSKDRPSSQPEGHFGRQPHDAPSSTPACSCDCTNATARRPACACDLTLS